MEAIKVWPLECAQSEAFRALPDTARLLVLALLRPEPRHRLGAPGGLAGGYDDLRAHAFFGTGEPPLDFAMLRTMPPPPLVPPPPLPAVLANGSVLNDKLARRGPLPPTDRAPLLRSQQRMRWSRLLDTASQELLLLATLVTKRRHLSAKRRHLILVEGLLPAAAAGARGVTDSADGGMDGNIGGDVGSSGDANGSGGNLNGPHGCRPAEPAYLPSSVRLFYVDPTTFVCKGIIPWSAELRAELLPRGHFHIHTPGRTYFLQDVCSPRHAIHVIHKTHLPTHIHTRQLAIGRSRSSGCKLYAVCRRG